ncbi:MAG: hypothetical protein KC505_00750, partial [Myxococcales bacterium]|nr:hypothetical protein [Myxococcales bacterium]
LVKFALILIVSVPTSAGSALSPITDALKSTSWSGRLYQSERLPETKIRFHLSHHLGSSAGSYYEIYRTYSEQIGTFQRWSEELLSNKKLPVETQVEAEESISDGKRKLSWLITEKPRSKKYYDEATGEYVDKDYFV